MNEVVASIAIRMGSTEEFVESHYTLEQILLKNYFVVREEKRLRDYSAVLMANKTAEILAKAFGG